MFRSTFLLTLSLALTAQAPAPTVKRSAAPYTSPASGAAMYMAYCASCHGPKGLGDGPVATDLKVPVPDLTQLAKRNQGVFPDVRVAQIIQGEGGARAHGGVDMPVWGPVFRVFDDRKSTTIHQRAANLTRYLAGLQAK